MTKYKNKLYHDLKKLGVKKGDVLMGHSSLRSVGSFINKPQIIVEVLKKVLGPFGTLLMPALTYENIVLSQPFFDEKQFDEPITPEEHRNQWDRVFSSLSGYVDYVAFQDRQVAFSRLKEFTVINKELAGKYYIESLANIESFERGLSNDF